MIQQLKLAAMAAALLSTLLASCAKTETEVLAGTAAAEISFSVPEFKTVVIGNAPQSGAAPRANSYNDYSYGPEEEREVKDVNVFLFNADGSNPLHFYLTADQWKYTTLRVNKTVAEVGTRDVYIVANAGQEITGVTTLKELQAWRKTEEKPWSTPGGGLTLPLLMDGSKKAHNFRETPRLESIPLTRAAAKLDVSIRLGANFRHTDGARYSYQYQNFDKNAYALKPANKRANPANNDWTIWSADDVRYYEGKVSNLYLTTYLNESGTDAPTKVWIRLPYLPAGGLLPPPEIGEGGETYTLPLLPVKVERNTQYIIHVEIN